MDDKEFIEKYKQDLLEAIAFYSNESKAKRELWVAREFLTNLQIEVSEKRLIPVSDDPPDIQFQVANFEIKEIMDENRQRHKEYKDALLKCDLVKNSSEILESYTPKELTFQDIIDITIYELSKYQQIYSPDIKQNLDMLFYFNLIDFHLTDDRTCRIPKDISKYGWRSVSVIRNNLSCVLYASSSAPDFLKPFTGKLIFRS